MIITIRRMAGQKVEILEEARSMSAGYARVEQLYIENQADQVALIEVDEAAVSKEDRYNVLYKLERNCKHRKGLQAIFLFTKSKSVMQCEVCGLMFGQEQNLGSSEPPSDASNTNVLEEAAIAV